MSLRKIYLEKDAPYVFPTKTDRPAKWGSEAVVFSYPVFPDEDIDHAKSRHDEETQLFIDEFIDSKHKETNGKVDKHVFLRFHLHKNVIQQLLNEENAVGISINLVARNYIFKSDNGHTSTELGTSIRVTAIDGKMQDLYDPENDGINERIYLEAKASPCPPRDPCPAQLKFIEVQNDDVSQL